MSATIFSGLLIDLETIVERTKNIKSLYQTFKLGKYDLVQPLKKQYDIDFIDFITDDVYINGKLNLNNEEDICKCLLRFSKYLEKHEFSSKIIFSSEKIIGPCNDEEYYATLIDVPLTINDEQREFLAEHNTNDEYKLMVYFIVDK